jgi:hypothetical protein
MISQLLCPCLICEEKCSGSSHTDPLGMRQIAPARLQKFGNFTHSSVTLDHGCQPPRFILALMRKGFAYINIFKWLISYVLSWFCTQNIMLPIIKNRIDYTLHIPTTISCPMVTICSTCFNVRKLCILPIECICMFRTVLTINSVCFPKQH